MGNACQKRMKENDGNIDIQMQQRYMLCKSARYMCGPEAEAQRRMQIQQAQQGHESGKRRMEAIPA